MAKRSLDASLFGTDGRDSHQQRYSCRLLIERPFLGIGPQPFLSSIPGGIVSFDHLGFRINATGGPDPGVILPALCQDTAPTVASFPLGPAGLIGALTLVGIFAATRGAQKWSTG